MTAITLKPKQILLQAWKIFKKRWTDYYPVLLVMFGVQLIVQLLGSYQQETQPVVLLLVVGIASWYLNMVMSIGFMRSLLNLVRGEAVEVAMLFDFKAKVWRYVWAMLRVALMVMLGLLLLIVPGIIWGIKYGFVPYLVVDKDMTASEAMKASAKLTAGVKGQIFKFSLWIILFSLGLVVVLGAAVALWGLVFGNWSMAGVGAITGLMILSFIVTMPVVYLAYALLYEKLLPRLEQD